MHIGSASSLVSSSVENAVQVKVLNSQRHQLEGMVGELFKGIEETDKLVESLAADKGQRLDMVA